MANRACGRTARRGYAMLTVLFFIALMMIMVALNQRRLSSILRVEEQRLASSDFHEGTGQATGMALDLLETGTPPSNPYVCSVDIETSSGTENFTVTFVSNAPNTWDVHVEPSSDSILPPPMPPFFSG